MRERMEDQRFQCYGVIREALLGNWVYRVYPAGNDGFGRPRRYFFLLFQVPAAVNNAVWREMAGVLQYFVRERGLPLNTEPLDHGVPPAEPDVVLKKLADQWQNGEHGAHWGMDESGRFVKFTRPTAKPMTPGSTPGPVGERKNTSRGHITQNWRFIPGFVVGLAAGFIIGWKTGLTQNLKQWSNEPQETESRAIERLSSQPEFNTLPAKKSHERSDSKGRLEQELQSDKRNKRADGPNRQD